LGASRGWWPWAECLKYFACDKFRLLPDQPCREAERPVPRDLQIVVTLHVVPALQRIVSVLRAVDLDDKLVLVPQDVDPAPAAARIAAGHLAARLGKPVGADHLPGEVQFRQRLGLASYIAGSAGDESTAF